MHDDAEIPEPAERTGDQPVVLVSNRGPVSYGTDGSAKRGTGGLVTALMGLASHRQSVWVASSLTEGDRAVAERAGAEAIEIEAPTGGAFDVRLVNSDPEAYDGFYNIIANPMLWFIQHYLWDLSNAPYIRQGEIDAFDYGYKQVNKDLADAVVEEYDRHGEPVVMVHDYHFYLLPKMVREQRPASSCTTSSTSRGRSGFVARAAAADPRGDLRRDLSNDIIGFHTGRTAGTSCSAARI